MAAMLKNSFRKHFGKRPERLAEAVRNEGKKIEGASGALDVYALPLIIHSMSVEGCKCFMFGEDSGKRNRTIMVLGGTGSGKTTMVNRMINYILGVSWDDTFRFKLVDEGTAKSQAHSQTSEVNVYRLYHQEGFKIDHSLTIVDTPGFGDTRGKVRDEETVRQIEMLFRAEHGVSEIDAICFVAQASNARLTETQKYVFDSVLKIFGKDVEENIRILVTSSVSTNPPVLEAIIEAQVPCPKGKDGLPIHFKFNNTDRKIPAANNEDDTSDDDEKEEDDLDKMFWKRGNKSMAKLFSALHESKTKSLTLTRKVLRERAQLEISVENLRIKIKMALTKLGEIKHETQILKTHESMIIDSGEFDYEVSVTRPAKLPGNNSVNCERCKVTCHQSCGLIWTLLYWIGIFNINGNCNECKCSDSNHVLEGFYWGTKTVTEKRTFKELKEKYERASSSAMSVGDIIKKMQLEYQQLREEVHRLMERSAQCLNTLKKIALRPDPFSTSDYIDMLIEEEKSGEKPGSLENIETLEGLKTNANTKEKDSPGVGTSPSAKEK